MLSGVEMVATEYPYCCQWVRTDLQNDTVTAREIYATELRRLGSSSKAVEGGRNAAARLGSWRSKGPRLGPDGSSSPRRQSLT